MALILIEHGDFLPSTAPDTLDISKVPSGTIFCRRVQDGADWYALAHGGEFAAVAVLATASDQGDGTFRLQAVVTDPQRLFPQNSRLLEISGYKGTDPQADLSGQIYDPSTKTLSPAPVPVVQVVTAKADIWRRATDAEAETIVEVLGRQTVRKQRLFADAQYIDHSDPLFADLLAGFVAAFGQTRTDEILASSR